MMQIKNIPKEIQSIDDQIKNVQQHVALDKQFLITLKKIKVQIECLSRNNYIFNNQKLFIQHCFVDSCFFVALQMIHCSKYPIKYQQKLIKHFSVWFPNINTSRFKISEVIIGEKYLPNHLAQYNIPLCRQIVSNFAIFELAEEFKFLTPLIIDSTGIFKSMIKKKYE